MIEAESNSLFKRQYTGALVNFEDVFPASVGPRHTFDWMLERTLMRPRDIIAFVNEAINAADGHSTISVTALRRAEVEFARKRTDALIQEWKSAYPTLVDMLDLIVLKRKFGLYVIDLLDKIDDFCLTTCSNGKVGFDPIFDTCRSYTEGGKRASLDVLCEILSVLYKTGTIGVKLSPQDKFAYLHLDQPLISPQLITADSKIRLRPMLHAAFNLQDRQQCAERLSPKRYSVGRADSPSQSAPS